ncbi:MULTISPECIES: DUF4350 domain-containing protein [unclassified Brevibacterium]|uniref:DUF4350 domain-containing protein n=1 Tax=unclassified Brevibacterium TaxID=2614124 RepID=UPI001092AB87|nr:DUF4350 domain-containing protein [Brevibacterium sp. S22]TGD33187.1 DUF4350 domain-containing protein [Brevibacterium sp. S22]
MSAQLDVAARGTRSSSRIPLRARLRSASVWIVAAFVILITVIALVLLTGDDESEEPLHYDSPARTGTKALVETLRDHDVDVTTTEDQEQARTAAARPDTTLLIPTNTEALSRGDIAGLQYALRTHGNRLVLVDPGPTVTEFTDRITVNDNLSPLATPDATSPPSCDSPITRQTGAVTTGDVEYAETKKGTDGISACYPFTGPGVDEIDGAEVPPGSARGQFVTDSRGSVPLTVLGNPDWVTNEHIDEEGNASLVLSQLSETQNLVVYYPTFDDAGQQQSAPSPIDFVPGWFLAGVLWLIPCVLVLLLVIGRRFGPLALERLPVIVPAVETVHGRAALSSRSHDREGALHTLRTGALLRIAKRLSLSPDARTPDIITRIAATTGADPGFLHHVFVSASARTDAELTELVHQLTQIESEIP